MRGWFGVCFSGLFPVSVEDKKKGGHAAHPSSKEATQFLGTRFITWRSVRRKTAASAAQRPKARDSRAISDWTQPGHDRLRRVMSDLVVAAVQMTSGEDVDANLERARELVREAATAGALIVGLPENFAYLGSRPGPQAGDRRDRCRPVGSRPSATTSGPILRAMRALALEGRASGCCSAVSRKEPARPTASTTPRCCSDPRGR